MKMNRSAQELLKRYLLGVKREIGGKESDDITAEIESYIGDLLEERYGNRPEIGSEELEAVLKEMGAPRKVAAQYPPQRYLIGPRLFPIYWLVVRILAAVVAGSLALSFFISIGLNPSDITLQRLFEFVGSIFSGVLSSAGAITLAFGIMERAMQDHQVEELKDMEEFKVSDLPDLPEEEKPFQPIGVILEIVVIALGMIFFTYLRETNGALPFFTEMDEYAGMARLFTDNFVKFIPVILALSGLEMGRNFTLLAQGRRTALTGWWAIIAKAANLALNVFLLGAMPLITLDFFRRIPGLNPGPQADQTANTVLSILLALSMLGSLVDIIRSSVQELRSPTE